MGVSVATGAFVIAPKPSRTRRLLCCASLLIPIGSQAESRAFGASVVLHGQSAELSKSDEAQLDELLSKRDMNCVKNLMEFWSIQLGWKESLITLQPRRVATARWLQAKGVDPRRVLQDDDAEPAPPGAAFVSS